MSFQLGDKDFTQEFIIADIDDLQGILGFDFLENNDIAVHAAKSSLEFRDKFVERFKVNNTIVSRIKISKFLTIPPNSTATIIGKLESVLTENAENMIFEPNNFDDLGVVMSKLLLKTNQPSFPIPIINISENSITFFEGQTIGSVDIVNNFEEQVIHAVHSIQENSEIVSQSSDKVVPEHLKSIFENISKSLTESRIEQIKDLLIAYQDIFMGPVNGKLGRTGLVKHTIDTGDARPIKLPPRRLSAKQKNR